MSELNYKKFKKTVSRDFSDLKEFYLDEERLERLSQMKNPKRGLYLGWWLIKSLFLNLNPVRRILLIVSIILFLNAPIVINLPKGRLMILFKEIGYVILLFVLMLELKDKLVAKNELSEGRAIQLALMPEEEPKISGWDVWLFTQPANDVGGDLVDFIKVGEERFSIFLGDVAGKGLSAALLMAKLQSTIRALATEHSSIPQLGKRINDIFFRDTTARTFASLIYMEIDTSSHQISLMNAGHPPPLLKQESQASSLKKGNLALGISKDSKYRTQKLTLNTGEMLILFSDGVTEAQNESGEFFGQDRLESIIAGFGAESAKKLGTQILEEVYQFMGETKPSDDISLALIQRLP